VSNEDSCPCRGRESTRPSRWRRGIRRRLRALRVAVWLGLGLGLAAGCGGGGGGASPEPSTPAAVATTPIDLAPGQTSAVLGWAPSRGPVDDYLVLEARNGGAWTFLARVNPPRVEVRGQPGDEIQIMTIAEGSNGSSSDPSPPSPILRFHAPAAPPRSAHTAAVAAVTGGSSSVAEPLATAVTAAPEADGESTNGVTRSQAMTPESPDSPDAKNPSVGDGTGSEVGNASLSLSLRDRLLRADLRFAVHQLSPRAAHWLADRVAEQPSAGLNLIASGRRDGDPWSELVWRDAAGQLFVSDGAVAAIRNDLRDTLEEAIRLRATERFVGLVDLEGDTIGDWLIEETTTGAVWIVDGATATTRAALVGAAPGAARLAGHGDFDGDGRVELVWRREDDSLFLEREDDGVGEVGEVATIPIDGLPPLSTEALLAIADFDGDGLDDLSTRSTEGRLELFLSRPLAGAGLGFERLAGPERRIESLELMASLDLDGDHASELVWLGENALEIWDVRRGPVTRIAWTEERGFEEQASPGEGGGGSGDSESDGDGD